jgi:hypothetical protein
LNGKHIFDSVRLQQVILRCKALEVVAEGCVAVPLPASHEPVLAQMFAAFLPNENGSCDALGRTLVRMSATLAEDAPDTQGAAQRAVHSLVAALKASAGQGPVEAESLNPVAAWLDRVSALDKEIARTQALLQKLGVANKGVVTR